MYYFSYGSNMNINHLQDYINNTNTVVVGIGELKNYIFKYQTLKGYNCSKKKSKANIQKRIGSTVLGVVLKIDKKTEKKLDVKEGVAGKRYKRIRVKVTICNKKYNCVCYVIDGPCIDWKPSKRYKKIIIKAAYQFNFPTNYIKRLNYL